MRTVGNILNVLRQRRLERSGVRGWKLVYGLDLLFLRFLWLLFFFVIVAVDISLSLMNFLSFRLLLLSNWLDSILDNDFGFGLNFGFIPVHFVSPLLAIFLINFHIALWYSARRWHHPIRLQLLILWQVRIWLDESFWEDWLALELIGVVIFINVVFVRHHIIHDHVVIGVRVLAQEWLRRIDELLWDIWLRQLIF